MSLPFTTEQFLEIFKQYNVAIWPLQVVVTAIGACTAVLAALGRRRSLVSILLASLWLWTAVVYHWTFFTRINPAAWLFGAVWLGGAAAFAWHAVRPPLRPPAGAVSALCRLVGGSLVVYALVLYPILGHFDGRAYPYAPTFGAPCPVTILTFGVLWLSAPIGRRYLLVAPLLWALVGSSAAFTLGVREDMGLAVAGLSGLVLLFRRVAAPAKQEAERVV
jgi:hypothetical protein